MTRHPPSVAVRDRILGPIRAAVGERGVIEDPAEMKPMLESWRDGWIGSAAVVVQPATTAELQAVVRICADAGVAIVTQGGNTGLTGGGQPREGGDEVLITTRRLNRIRSIDIENDTMVVESGCILADVQSAARRHDRLFPLSLGAEGSCTIGGNIATNAGGINALRYGSMRELVVGLEVVMPDGRLWDGLRALRKDNAGYNLRHVFIGSEGTLGIVTAAVLKLAPLPRVSATVMVGMESPDRALGWLQRLKARFGERLQACELIERVCIEVARRHVPDIRDPLATPHPWYVLAEVASQDAEDDLADGIGAAFAEALEAGEVVDGVIASSIDQAAALWRIREAIPEGQKHEGVSFKHDISVPVSKVPRFLAEANAALAVAFPGIRPFAFGHLGDGNIHFNPIQASGEPGDLWEMRLAAANRITHDIAVGLGGSISAEHGIGRLRLEEMKHYKPELEIELMARLKAAFDPAGLLNPGKVLG
jgi:FAD/FMN-containing dehydrogenase